MDNGIALIYFSTLVLSVIMVAAGCVFDKENLMFVGAVIAFSIITITCACALFAGIMIVCKGG